MSINGNNYVEGNKYFDKDKVLFTTKAKIQSHLVLTNSIIVLVNADELSSDRNIFGYDAGGFLKWQIPAPDVLHSQYYYTSIYLSPSKELQAYSKNGVEVTIDVETGEIIHKELIK